MNTILIFFLSKSWAEAPEVNADLKHFFTVTSPYEFILMPPNAYAQAYVDGRVKVLWTPIDSLKIEGHHVITAGTLAPETELERELKALGIEDVEESDGNTFMTGVGLNAPEAVDLSWAVQDEEFFLQGRTDRLLIRYRFGKVDMTLGRQAVGLGNGMMFNPMDLVQPFSFATIDSEYKPGVDAFRVDGYLGMNGQVGLVTAYSGDWTVDGLTAISYAKHQAGPTEISYILGAVRSDIVLGLGSSTALGAVGLHVDATVTVPEDEETEPFVRAVAGVFARPLMRSSLTTEFYMQSLGAERPEDYLEFASSDRYDRGELWLLGRYYASIVWGQELGPLVTANLSSTLNLEDGSAFLGPVLNYSISDEVQAVIGGFFGVGARPKSPEITSLLLGDNVDINSEFGLYPSSIFVQTRSYF